jgi:hydroxyacylglutathione hydrolase
LFTGDTFFIGGCGKVFDGTAESLFYSLQKILSLPNETLVFGGKEYTVKNLEFAK